MFFQLKKGFQLIQTSTHWFQMDTSFEDIKFSLRSGFGELNFIGDFELYILFKRKD